MTVAQLETAMSAAELREWVDFAVEEPFGARVEDLRFGLIAATLCNLERDPKRRSKPYSPADFALAWGAGKPVDEEDKPAPELTPQQEATALDALFGFK